MRDTDAARSARREGTEDIAQALFAGDGEARALCRAVDWAATSIGPVETWPQQIRSAVRLCLDSGLPSIVRAGPEQVLVYNDAYMRSVLASFGTHESGQGQTARVVWASIWAQSEPIYARVSAGHPVFLEDAPFTLSNGGSGSEMSYWTISASPIRADDGTVLGILSHAFETTSRVRGEQALHANEARQVFLLKLSDEISSLSEASEIMETASRLLGDHLQVDRTIYAENEGEDGSRVGVVLAQHVRRGSRLPDGVTYEAKAQGWASEQLRRGEPVVVTDTANDARLGADVQAVWLAANVHALAVVSLIKFGRDVLNFGCQHTEPRNWTPAEIALIREVAERTWAAAERARAEAALRRSEARQAFLLRLGDALRPLGDPAEVQGVVCRMLGEHLGANQVHYGETIGDVVVIEQGYGSGLPSMVGTFRHMDFGERLIATYRAGRTAVCVDAANDPTITPAETAVITGAGFRAYLAVPLVKAGQWVATLAVHSIEPRAWTADEIALVEEVAERTWATVERAYAEAALRRSEVRYRTLFETIDEGFCIIELVTDDDGHVTDLLIREINAAFERQSGLVNAIGRSMRELLANYEQEWLDLYARVAETGVSERVETYLGDVDRWHVAHYSRVGGEGSRLVSVVFDDISERKRAEMASKESEARQAFLLGLSDALRSVADPVAIQSISARRLGTHLRASHALYYGVERAADGYVHVVEQDFYRGDGMVSQVGRYALAASNNVFAPLAEGRTVTVPDVAGLPGISDDVLNAYRAAQCLAFVAVPLTKQGQYVAGFVVQHASPHAWSESEIALIEAVAERTWSAVERARAEASLSETQRRLDETLATARMAYWDWDPETDTIAASESIHDLFGLLPGERFGASGQGVALVHPDDVDAQQASVQDATRDGRGWHLEFRIVRPRDGSIVWVEERATITRDPVTNALHTTGLVWDISDRKRAEAAAELERRTRERDVLLRELATAEEAERRRLARELHDQLGQQLTGLSLGLEEVSRLVGAPERDRRDDNAALIQRLQRLKTLTHEMTSGARYLALELRPPELDDMGFENALETYAAEWSGRFGVSAEVVVIGESDAPLPPDVGSALYRIAQETLTNTAKHAQATSVSVIVEKTNHSVRLIIEDDGVGFDADVIARRARRERRLGLAGIQERAAILGGSVDIESAPNRGTTVFVNVPVGPRPPAQSE